jgi:hypothetical protein
MSKPPIEFNFAIFLLSFMVITLINSNPALFGQSDNMSEHMTPVEEGQMGEGEGEAGDGEKLVSSLSEWIGVFSIGMMAGLLVFKTDASSGDNRPLERKKRIIMSIAILSLSVGAIHILLVQEHSKESILWGIFFLISGIAQIVFGIIIAFVRENKTSTILYYVGIIGNALLVGTFILVRLVTPPFSPENAPVNELEPNSIITLIIEVSMVILLGYIVKYKDKTKDVIK